MHDDTFDQATRERVIGVQRRGFLTLAGALAALTVARPDADAGSNRRKKRKKCTKGRTKCGKQCVNLSADGANCGSCSTFCTGGKVCSRGTCACTANQSFVAGTCIPRFGCTLDMDTCAVGKKACPDVPSDADGRCHVSADGEPFCATALTCETVSDSSACPTIGGKSRTLIPCVVCQDPGETGACVLPIAQIGGNP